MNDRVITGVDAHAHVLRLDAPLVADRHSEPSRDASVTEYLALLDANGLSHGILTAPSFYGTDNTLLLDALASAPGRLRGTVQISPETEPSRLAELREQGVVGIRLNWAKRRRFPDPAAPEYQRLFACARDLAMHIELLIEDEHLPVVGEAVLRTGAELVLDHFGLPAGHDSIGFTAVLRALEQGSTWVKLSAPYRSPVSTMDEIVRSLLAVAPDRLLWASDWPWLQHENDIEDYATCLRWLSDWIPDPATRRAILVDNPVRAFRLDA